MWATAPYLKLTHPTQSYEVIPAIVIQTPTRKNYCKGAGSQLPVFPVKIYEILFNSERVLSLYKEGWL